MSNLISYPVLTVLPGFNQFDSFLRQLLLSMSGFLKRNQTVTKKNISSLVIEMKIFFCTYKINFNIYSLTVNFLLVIGSSRYCLIPFFRLF